jgi:predicted pyridoxine 5'-phosphate oxidase superfamily flavin-nucleotide-binding protein
VDKLSEDIIRFFQAQNFVLVSTIDPSGTPHNSCKDVVKIDQSGEIYLLDVYKGNTYGNLARNQRISVTAVEESSFTGYCLKGKARIVPRQEFNPDIIAVWEQRITGRIAQRLIRNVQEKKVNPGHPEARLPMPEYLIFMEVEDIVDLTPKQLK